MTEELSGLIKSMDSKWSCFTRDVNNIKDRLNEIDQRLDKSKQAAGANEIHEEHWYDTARRQLSAVNRIADLGPTEDIQAEFKNSVQTVTLPPHIRLLAEKTGIKRVEQSKLNIKVTDILLKCKLTFYKNCLKFYLKL